MGEGTFYEEYFRFCDNILRHENHHNILVLANYNFQKDIYTDEKLSTAFRMVNDDNQGIINMIFDHQIIFSKDVEEYVFVNCGYENNVGAALKPFLDKERSRLIEETFRHNWDEPKSTDFI